MSIIDTAAKAFNTYGAIKSTVGTVAGVLGVTDKLGPLGDVLGLKAASSQPLKPQNPVNLISKLKMSNFARTNFFEVQITAPPRLTGDASKLELRLYAQSTVIPTISIATSELRQHGFGPIEKFGYAPTFNDIDVTFIADGRGDIYKFFYKWMSMITNFDSKTINDGKSTWGLKPFQVGYKDEYQCDITIYTYNERFDKVLQFKLMKAFPISVQVSQLNWADNDQLMTFTVQFSYYNMLLDNYAEQFQGSAGQPNNLSVVEKLFKAGSVVQLLGSLKKPTSIGDIVNVVGNAKLAVEGVKGLFP